MNETGTMSSHIPNASFMKICQPPALYKRKTKSTSKPNDTFSKGFNHSQYSPLSKHSFGSRHPNTSFFSSP
jgi:hypothetical protein